MRRLALFVLFAALAFGQSNDPFKPKPPADVDAALLRPGPGVFLAST